MSRVPIRLRLTAAFALAMVVVLAAAGLFVYLRLQSDLNESVDSALEARAAAVASSGRAPAGAASEAEEGFAQVLTENGRVIDSTAGAGEPLLTRSEVARAAAEGDIVAERAVPGIEGTARILAQADGAEVVAVGQSLDDRDETLAGVAASFAVGGPLAVLAASLVGYLLAASALRPVEAIRRRAAEVSLDRPGEPLPLPPARDEIRRLGQTLNEMLDRLRASYDREREFVADASHELRTPVAVIKTELEAALRAGDHHPQVREALVAAVEECDHLAQLAEDLLVLVRTGDGELPVQAEDLPAGELVGAVRDRFAQRAGERGRVIRTDVSNGLRLRGDELRLRQALGNLVDNALRYGEGDVVLGAHRAGAGAELEVADSGPGFPPELAGRAFERFARGDAARTRGGTGLGLAIVRAIAEAHGGEAELVRSDGTGAIVRIRLPA